MKITSAYANKMLKSLTEDKDYWASKELSSNTYVAAVGEEPVIPDYDYAAVAATIEKIDQKIVKIKRPESGQCHCENHGRQYRNERRQYSGSNGPA